MDGLKLFPRTPKRLHMEELSKRRTNGVKDGVLRGVTQRDSGSTASRATRTDESDRDHESL
jgi:hypothetical protein